MLNKISKNTIQESLKKGFCNFLIGKSSYESDESIQVFDKGEYESCSFIRYECPEVFIVSEVSTLIDICKEEELLRLIQDGVKCIGCTLRTHYVEIENLVNAYNLGDKLRVEFIPIKILRFYLFNLRDHFHKMMGFSDTDKSRSESRPIQVELKYRATKENYSDEGWTLELLRFINNTEEYRYDFN